MVLSAASRSSKNCVSTFFCCQLTGVIECNADGNIMTENIKIKIIIPAQQKKCWRNCCRIELLNLSL
jgi:hypothetical protein